jgi:hypothetical protein
MAFYGYAARIVNAYGGVALFERIKDPTIMKEAAQAAELDIIGYNED